MMKKILSFIAIAAVAAVAFISCEEKPEVPTDIALKGITVSPATYSLAVGETKALTVAYDPADATIKPEVEWTSSNPEVATVDGRGTVTGVAAGTADIVAKAGEFTAKCVVTVVGEPGPGPEPEDKWDYTPCADYSAASNLWKPVFDADGENYFYYFCNGSDWNGKDTETTDVPFLEKKTSTYKITIENGTSSAWQNQIFIMPNTGHEIALDATKQYRIQVTFGASVATRGFIKMLTYGESSPKHEGALIYEVGEFQMTPDAPTVIDFPAISRVSCDNINFVMDFGGAPAGTIIYIKDIIVAEDGDAPEPEDTWDYTPSAEYLAETNLWKAIADVDGEDFTGSAMMGIYKNQSTYRFHFEQATNGDWANFGFIYTKEGTPLTMSAGKKYKVQYTICSTAALTRAFLKINKDDPATEGHEDGYIWETNQTLEANTPKVVSDVLQGVDAPSIAFTIDFGGNPAGVTIYIKDIIIEEVVPAVPAALAGTYKVTNLKILGGLYIGAIEEFKDKSWMWNSSINKEYDNLLVVNAEDATVDYQPGDDGAYWDYVLISDKNKLGTGDLDVSANFAQLPHEKVSLNVDMTTGIVTIGGTVTAQAYMPGEYSMSVDWCSTHGNFTVPEGSIALAFKCANMPQETYSGLDQSTYLYTDFDRFAIHPFAMIMIFAKQ